MKIPVTVIIEATTEPGKDTATVVETFQVEAGNVWEAVNKARAIVPVGERVREVIATGPK